jgi:hypothetical protein
MPMKAMPKPQAAFRSGRNKPVESYRYNLRTRSRDGSAIARLGTDRHKSHKLYNGSSAEWKMFDDLSVKKG